MSRISVGNNVKASARLCRAHRPISGAPSALSEATCDDQYAENCKTCNSADVAQWENNAQVFP